MPFENKAGQGILFKNQSDNPKAPQYKGNFKAPDGTDYEIAGWTVRDEQGAAKRDKNGNPMMSLKVSYPFNKEERRQSTMTRPNTEPDDPGPDLNDFVPF